MKLKTIYSIRYEDFLQNPEGVLNLFQSKLSITLNSNEIKVFNKSDKPVYVNQELLSRANAIYINLSKLCLKPVAQNLESKEVLGRIKKAFICKGPYSIIMRSVCISDPN